MMPYKTNVAMIHVMQMAMAAIGSGADGGADNLHNEDEMRAHAEGEMVCGDVTYVLLSQEMAHVVSSGEGDGLTETTVYISWHDG